MKRHVLKLFVACTALLMLVVSCNKQQEAVKGFAEKFAGYVEKDQRDSIIAVYPGAEFADKIEVNFKPENLKVDKTDKENEYLVSFGDKETMLVSVNEDGQMRVVESNGLFKYSDAKIEFAKKVGAVKKDMNDETLAKRMIQVDNLSTELFNEYVAGRKNAVKNLGFTVTYEPTFGMEEGTGYYTLKNTTDQPIGGDEYEITYSGWEYYAGMPNERTWKDVVPGKDIPAKGSIRLDEKFTFHFNRELKSITMHTPSQESFFKNYKPTGDEYDNYVKVHGQEVVKKADIGNGPFTLVGKIGGKYAVHVTLDKGMKKGSYYYDKSGPKAKLDLQVKSFNQNTGELTMDEVNSKGEMTGTFVGVLTPDSYTGSMRTYEGRNFDFTLEVVK